MIIAARTAAVARATGFSLLHCDDKRELLGLSSAAKMPAPDSDRRIMPSQRTTAETTPAPASGSRLRFELLFVSGWLAVGLFLVPAVVYWVYSKLLGPYAENAGLGTFYGAYFADLAALTGRTWLLTLGPLLAISLIRILFIGVGRKDADRNDPDDTPQPPRKVSSSQTRRVEPRVGG
jgi:hypothetical protein